MLKELSKVPFGAFLKAVLNRNLVNRAKEKKALPMELRSYRVTILKSFIHVTNNFTKDSCLGNTWQLITKSNLITSGAEEVIYSVLAALLFDMEDKNMRKNADVVRSLVEQYLLGALTIQHGKLVELLPSSDDKDCRYGYADALKNKVHMIENRVKLTDAEAIEDISNIRKATLGKSALTMESKLNSSLHGRPKLEGGTPGEWNRIEVNQSEGASEMLDFLDDDDELLDTPILTGPQKKLEEIVVAGTNEPDDSWVDPNKETIMSDDLKLDFDKEHSNPAIAENILVAEEESERRMAREERGRQQKIYLKEEAANRDFIRRERAGKLEEGETMPYPVKRMTDEEIEQAHRTSAKLAEIRKRKEANAKKALDDDTSNLTGAQQAFATAGFFGSPSLGSSVPHDPPVPEGPGNDIDQKYFEEKEQLRIEKLRLEQEAAADAQLIEEAFTKIDDDVPDLLPEFLPVPPGKENKPYVKNELPSTPAEIESMLTGVIDLENPDNEFHPDHDDFQLVDPREEREDTNAFAARMRSILEDSHGGDIDETTSADLDILSTVNTANMETPEEPVASKPIHSFDAPAASLGTKLEFDTPEEDPMLNYDQVTQIQQGVWDTNVFLEEPSGKIVQTHINRSNEEPLPIIYHDDGRVTDSVGTPLVQFEGEYVRTTPRAFSNYLLANTRFLDNGISLDYETYEIIYLKSILGSLYTSPSDKQVISGLKGLNMKITGDEQLDRVVYEVAIHRQHIYKDRFFDHAQFTSKGSAIHWNQEQFTEQELERIQEGKLYKGLYGFVDYMVPEPFAENPRYVWQFLEERDCCLAELLEVMVDHYPENLLLNARFETAPHFRDLHVKLFSGTSIRHDTRKSKVYGNKSTARLVRYAGIDPNMDTENIPDSEYPMDASYDNMLKYCPNELSIAVRFFHGAKTFIPVDKVGYTLLGEQPVDLESELDEVGEFDIIVDGEAQEVPTESPVDDMEELAKERLRAHSAKYMNQQSPKVELGKGIKDDPVVMVEPEQPKAIADIMAVKVTPYVEPTFKLTVKEEVDNYINNFIPPEETEVIEEDPKVDLLDKLKPLPENAQFVDIYKTFDLALKVEGALPSGRVVIGVTHSCNYKNAGALRTVGQNETLVRFAHLTIIQTYLMRNVEFGAFNYCPGVVGMGTNKGLLVRKESAALGLRNKMVGNGDKVFAFTNGLPVLVNPQGEVYMYSEEEELINGVVSNGLVYDWITNDEYWDELDHGEFKQVRDTFKLNRNEIIEHIANYDHAHTLKSMKAMSVNPDILAINMKKLWETGNVCDLANLKKSDPSGNWLQSKSYNFMPEPGVTNVHKVSEKKRYFPVPKVVRKIERKPLTFTFDETIMVSFTAETGEVLDYPCVRQSITGLKAENGASLAFENINVGYESEVLVTKQRSGKLLEIIVRKEKVLDYLKHAGRELYVEPIALADDEGAVADICVKAGSELHSVDVSVIAKSKNTVSGPVSNVLNYVKELDNLEDDTMLYATNLETVITAVDVKGEHGPEIENMLKRSKEQANNVVGNTVAMVGAIRVIDPAAAEQLNERLTNDVNKALIEVTPNLTIDNAETEFKEMIQILKQHNLLRMTVEKIVAQWRKYSFKIVDSGGKDFLILNEKVFISPMAIESEGVVTGKVDAALTPELYSGINSCLTSVGDEIHSSMLITMDNGKVIEVIREQVDAEGKGTGSIRIRTVYKI